MLLLLLLPNNNNNNNTPTRTRMRTIVVHRRLNNNRKEEDTDEMIVMVVEDREGTAEEEVGEGVVGEGGMHRRRLLRLQRRLRRGGWIKLLFVLSSFLPSLHTAVVSPSTTNNRRGESRESRIETNVCDFILQVIAQVLAMTQAQIDMLPPEHRNTIIQIVRPSPSPSNSPSSLLLSSNLFVFVKSEWVQRRGVLIRCVEIESSGCCRWTSISWMDKGRLQF